MLKHSKEKTSFVSILTWKNFGMFFKGHDNFKNIFAAICLS